MQLLVIRFVIKMFHKVLCKFSYYSQTQYIPGQHLSSIHVKNVYAATTLIDFMRIVATKNILAYFIVK